MLSAFPCFRDKLPLPAIADVLSGKSFVGLLGLSGVAAGLAANRFAEASRLEELLLTGCECECLSTILAG